MKIETTLKCQVLIRTWRILKSYFEYECNGNPTGKLEITKTNKSETYYCGVNYITRTANHIRISGFNVKDLMKLIVTIQNILVEDKLSSYVVNQDVNYNNINHGIAKELFEKDIFHHFYLHLEDELY